MEDPQDSMIEEREELMVSPTGGYPFLKKAFFLKPISSSAIDEPAFQMISQCLSSVPANFDPKKWPLKVEFRGWAKGRADWKTWVDQMVPVHQSTWKKAGIHEAIFNSTYQIRRDKDLVYGVAEKWCSQTNSFIFPWGEATITLEDVVVLGGYSVLGDSVSRPLDAAEVKVKKMYCSTSGKAATTYVWKKKFMNSGTEFEHYAFLVCWLSRYVFLGGRHDDLISIAIHLARGIRIALAPAVLASIYRDLSLLKNAIVGSSQLEIGTDVALHVTLKSPFQLVQVWAWENRQSINYEEPRMARWEKVDGPKVENLRKDLDSAGEHFMWRPYALNVMKNWNLPKYYPQNEMWVSVCPDLDDDLLSFVRSLIVSELVGFGTVQHYLPHRVAMQFGYDQDLPCPGTMPSCCSGISSEHCNAEINNVKLYIPSRLSEADVSTKYLKWWKQSVSCPADACAVGLWLNFFGPFICVNPKPHILKRPSFVVHSRSPIVRSFRTICWSRGWGLCRVYWLQI